MSDTLGLTGRGLDIAALDRVARGDTRVSLAPEASVRVKAARAVVETFASGDRPIYGLNTGLGANLKHRLSPAEITAIVTTPYENVPVDENGVPLF